MDKDRNSASESEGESSLDETTNINDFASTLINGTANNEPETNATLSQRVFHAAKDGMALTLYALLANQARPQQVCETNYYIKSEHRYGLKMLISCLNLRRFPI